MGTEVYAVIGVLFTMWVGWISITTVQNNIKINGLMSIKEGMAGLKQDIGTLSNRLDVFLNKELDALKEIAEKK
jgi:hypothetical protein